jgi:hypothetical protein
MTLILWQSGNAITLPWLVPGPAFHLALFAVMIAFFQPLSFSPASAQMPNIIDEQLSL